ncbi:hypothetical protein [Enterobacter cloacae]|uniref:hypothetical protein n=1 Tax=Enterobacter cloacae TaxID=550 RepID=UPI00388F0520
MLDSTGKLAVHNVAGGAGVALALQHNYIGGGDIRDAVPAGDTGAAIMCEDDVDYHMLVKAGEVLLENEGWFLPVTARWPSRPHQPPTGSSFIHAKKSPLAQKLSS